MPLFTLFRYGLASILMVMTVTTSAAASDATVYLHNDRWDEVRVEVRVGKYVTCEKNDLYATRLLLRGETLTVEVSGQDVCYRREAHPGRPERGWSAWTYVPVTFGEYHVRL